MNTINSFNKVVDDIRPEEPLSEEAMGILMSIILNGGDPKISEVVTPDHEILNDMPQAKAFMLRIHNLTDLKLTLGAVIMVALHIESFGDATMYAYYLHRKCNPDTIVTADNLSSDVFPWGMLSKTQRNKMWGAQKIDKDDAKEDIGNPIAMGHDNLLDYAGVWESVITI